MSKRKLELIDRLRNTDATISMLRGNIDGHARGQRYKDLATDAATLAKLATEAARERQELNAILDVEWEARRRG